MGHTSGRGVGITNASAWLIAAVTFAGCGRVGYATTSGLEDFDGGTSADAGGIPSQLSDQDAAVVRDGGPQGGGQNDGGAALDSGPALDAGSPIDAAPGLDAGMPDAGRPDAGRPDAGRPDAGMPDAGMPDAGQPILGCAAVSGVLACEDFEAGNPASPWQRTGLGTFSRIRQTTERGDFIGRFRAAPGTRATFRRSITPLQTGDDIYMRAFVRVNANAAASWNVLLQAESATFSAKTSIDFTGNAELNATRSASAFVSAGFPTRRWACIEAHFFLSTSAGRIDVDVDGASVGQRTGVNTAVPSEGLANLFFGIISDSGNTATLEVEYDDVIFSENPIGCN